jgi:hypothetical protein
MIYGNDAELRLREYEGRPLLVLKGALILLCLGFFTLVMWAGESGFDRCAKEIPAAREACLDNLNAQTPQRPAKGAFPLVPRAAERAAD